MKKKEDKVEVHIGMGESGYYTTKQIKYGIIFLLLLLGLVILGLYFDLLF